MLQKNSGRPRLVADGEGARCPLPKNTTFPLSALLSALEKLGSTCQ